jgi:3-oxoacyl-(acyl-carrier-protein) synthase
LAALVKLAAGHVAVRFGAKGPNTAAATACPTGAHAIGDAFRLIQNGYADAMICGRAEASITPLGIAGFSAMRALSTRNERPEQASRRWDRARDGFVVGEGGAAGVIEAGIKVLALRDQVAPLTINLDSPDDDNRLNLIAHRSVLMPIVHAMTIPLASAARIRV